ncbi:MAG: vitamin K epoxide reductase family protein, partial [Planctomycetota bacterium]
MQQGATLSRARTIAIAIVALLATLLGLALRWETARHQISGLASSCTISETIDCDKVQSSEYSSILGVSLSVWGAAGNLILLSWILAARRGFGSLLAAAGLLAAFSLCVSLYLFYVSWFELEAVCLYCSAIQLCSLLLAILIIPAALRAGPPAPSPRPALAGLLFAALFTFLAFVGEAYAAGRTELLSLYRQEGGVRMRVDISGAAVLGNPEAEHAAVLYMDFSCPNCRDCYAKAKSIVDDRDPRLKGRIKIVLKHFPLDRTCNKGADSTKYPGSCDAAAAAQAATMIGRPRTAYDELFPQSTYFPQILDALGKDLKVEPQDWRALRASDRAKDLVARDVAEGIEMRFDRVPMAFLEGRPIDPSRLRERVEKLLG